MIVHLVTIPEVQPKLLPVRKTLAHAVTLIYVQSCFVFDPSNSLRVIQYEIFFMAQSGSLFTKFLFIESPVTFLGRYLRYLMRGRRHKPPFPQTQQLPSLHKINCLTRQPLLSQILVDTYEALIPS